jgi:transposase-like protein
VRLRSRRAQREPDQPTQRLSTATGRRGPSTVELRIPKLRRGSCFPGFLEPPRMAEKALTAVIVALVVNTNGRREVLGMTIGSSEAEQFSVEFLRSLARRGLRGATWQRCSVHFMCNAMAYAGKAHRSAAPRRVVCACIGTALAQDDADAARKQ